MTPLRSPKDAPDSVLFLLLAESDFNNERLTPGGIVI
jgi:hypothetical protein